MALKDLGAAIVLCALKDLAMGPIRVGHADYGSAEIFLLKPNEELRMCCDMAGINAGMVVRVSNKLKEYCAEHGFLDKNKIVPILAGITGVRPAQIEEEEENSPEPVELDLEEEIV